uniref:BTB domain-containing protein n=1 Tax=Panagrolaimus davidi TaxID=227884 RepID=A0A914PNC6_9BILA
MDISDVSLCVSGEEIKAHKLILYLHSPCLAAMIKQDDWETAGTTKIDIEGFAPLTVQKALEFMYTESIAQVDELQVDQMMELSRFATMFSISDLKDFINNQIINAVNTATACQLANLSMEYNEDAIHTTALEFITKNLQAIKLDESFENLSGENAKAILRML